jgi:hypothetical protein
MQPKVTMGDLNEILEHERKELRLGYLGAFALLVVAAFIIVAWFIYL